MTDIEFAHSGMGLFPVGFTCAAASGNVDQAAVSVSGWSAQPANGDHNGNLPNVLSGNCEAFQTTKENGSFTATTATVSSDATAFFLASGPQESVPQANVFFTASSESNAASNHVEMSNGCEPTASWPCMDETIRRKRSHAESVAHSDGHRASCGMKRLCSALPYSYGHATAFGSQAFSNGDCEMQVETECTHAKEDAETIQRRFAEQSRCDSQGGFHGL